LKNTEDYVKTRELVYEIMHQKAMDLITKGEKVVIDATYLGPQREILISLLNKNQLVDQSLFVVVKTDEAEVIRRIKKLKDLEKGKSYFDGWSQAYYWFTEKLNSGEIRYPQENLDHLKVIEIRN